MLKEKQLTLFLVSFSFSFSFLEPEAEQNKRRKECISFRISRRQAMIKTICESA